MSWFPKNVEMTSHCLAHILKRAVDANNLTKPKTKQKRVLQTLHRYFLKACQLLTFISVTVFYSLVKEICEVAKKLVIFFINLTHGKVKMKRSIAKVVLFTQSTLLPLVVLICPLVVLVCPFVCLFVVLVCPLVVSVCPLVVLV